MRNGCGPMPASCIDSRNSSVVNGSVRPPLRARIAVAIAWIDAVRKEPQRGGRVRQLASVPSDRYRPPKRTVPTLPPSAFSRRSASATAAARNPSALSSRSSVTSRSLGANLGMSSRACSRSISRSNRHDGPPMAVRRGVAHQPLVLLNRGVVVRPLDCLHMVEPIARLAPLVPHCTAPRILSLRGCPHEQRAASADGAADVVPAQPVARPVAMPARPRSQLAGYLRFLASTIRSSGGWPVTENRHLGLEGQCVERDALRDSCAKGNCIPHLWPFTLALCPTLDMPTSHDRTPPVWST